MSLGGLSGAIAEGIAVYRAAQIEFDAEAGHEYYAEYSGLTILNMGYSIKDKTTGKVLLDAKPSKPKPS